MPNSYTVSSLFAELKTMLDDTFPEEVQVSGELSNFTAAGSGHWYFALKDENAQLRCVMFRNANSSLGFLPQDGSVIRLVGRLSFYRERGDFQLIANQMMVGGQGDLQRQFEELKRRLFAEGLFADERKRPIPQLISRLGLITSESGAAIHDVLKVLARRMPMMQITLFPVAVQGAEAPPQLIAALAAANRHPNLDAILITRGGGSIEDLWAFNDEALVRAIVASPRPVMTAIGHEIDYTLADFAADKRAATPSAAAEQLSIDSADWVEWLDGLAERIKRSLDEYIHSRMQRCDLLQARYLRNDPLTVFSSRLDELYRRLYESMRYYQLTVRDALAKWQNRLLALAPHRQQRQREVQLKELALRLRHGGDSLLRDYQIRLRDYDRALRSGQRVSINSLSGQLNRWERVIKALSPLAVLARGYALVTDKKGQLVRSAADVRVEDKMDVRLAAGRLAARVEHIYKQAHKPGNRDLFEDD